MTEPATIHHKEVHVDFSKSSGPAVISTQPVINGQYPAADVQYDRQTAMAVFVSSPPIVAQKPDAKLKPKDFVMTSCFVIFACNFIFGLLGYNWGVKSNHAWQIGDIAQARKHAKVALIFVICGIIFGLGTYALAFSLFFVGKSSSS